MHIEKCPSNGVWWERKRCSCWRLGIGEDGKEVGGPQGSQSGGHLLEKCGKVAAGAVGGHIRRGVGLGVVDGEDGLPISVVAQAAA